jgi:hypothetical protein
VARPPLKTTVKVEGLTEWRRDVRKAEKDTQKRTREGLKRAGEPVRDEWRSTFSPIHPYSASKLRIRLGAKGVFVDQPLKKTTGLRPDFGKLQQRYGERALERKADEAERVLAREIDKLADTAEGTM